MTNSIYNLIWSRSNKIIVENFSDYNTALNAYIDLFNSTNNNTDIVKECVDNYVNEQSQYHIAQFSLIHSDHLITIRLERNILN